MAVVHGLIDKVDYVQRETRGLKQDVDGCKSDVSKLQIKLSELEDRKRRNNVRIVGLSPNREGGDAIRFLQEMLPKWIPSLSNKPIEIERAHRIYGRQRSTETGHTMIFKVLRYQDRQAILDGAREVSKRGPVLDGENSLRSFADYSAHTSQKWRSFADTRKELRAAGIQSFLIYPAILRVMHNGEKLSFLINHLSSLDRYVTVLKFNIAFRIAFLVPDGHH
ncbi:LINE-1 type transposase domain-containing 1 [Labeo rohita]|uniref:LINE-1 type transposase domain-containing 1 n=1 Tax=Labeo rohita TaxID=84645 RepID=A0A498MAV8_LABRO|nr:LINE-1 type transposase domain-containing 1 [Labeo rohita]RXN24936.1 LINE-1 type transposase domain-containing 1 [Labeo rohita]